MDEVVLTIAGVKHWLWRAMDQTGMVLDVLEQSRRDKQAAKRLLRKLLKRQCRAPRVMVTDKLANYGAAKHEVIPSVEHRRHKGLNNRAETSHQPTRRRERQVKRIKSARQAQRFPSTHGGINHFLHLCRHRMHATQYRAAWTQAFQVRAEVTGVAAAAWPWARRPCRAPSRRVDSALSNATGVASVNPSRQKTHFFKTNCQPTMWGLTDKLSGSAQPSNRWRRRMQEDASVVHIHSCFRVSCQGRC